MGTNQVPTPADSVTDSAAVQLRDRSPRRGVKDGAHLLLIPLLRMPEAFHQRLDADAVGED